MLIRNQNKVHGKHRGRSNFRLFTVTLYINTIDFIIKQQKPDEDFEVFTAEMERKINDLTRDQADQIMNPHKTEGMAREQLIMDMLTQYLG